MIALALAAHLLQPLRGPTTPVVHVEMRVRPEQGRPASDLLRQLRAAAEIGRPDDEPTPEWYRRYWALFEASLIQPAIANAADAGGRIPAGPAADTDRSSVDEIDRRFLAFMELVAQQMEARIRAGDFRLDGRPMPPTLVGLAPGTIAQELVGTLRLFMGKGGETAITKKMAAFGVVPLPADLVNPKVDPDNRAATLAALDKDDDGRIDAQGAHLPTEVAYALHDALTTLMAAIGAR